MKFDKDKIYELTTIVDSLAIMKTRFDIKEITIRELKRSIDLIIPPGYRPQIIYSAGFDFVFRQLKYSPQNLSESNLKLSFSCRYFPIDLYFKVIDIIHNDGFKMKSYNGLKLIETIG